MSEVSLKIVSCIRNEIRARKITIKQFSKMMDVSEPTMKRWLNAKGLLLEDWTRMLKVLNLSPLEAISAAQLNLRKQFEYSTNQEEAFVRTPGLLAFFQQLIEGLSVKEISFNYHLTQASCSFYLKRLDDLDLIRWGSGQSYSLVNSGEPKWKKQGPLSRAFRSKVFNELVINNKDSDKLRLAIYRLSMADAAKLQEMIADVFNFASNAEVRNKITREKSKTIGLAILDSEFHPDFLYSIPNKK